MLIDGTPATWYQTTTPSPTAKAVVIKHYISLTHSLSEFVLNEDKQS